MILVDNDSTDKQALVKLLRELSAHALYPIESMKQWLSDCGVTTEADSAAGKLFVFAEVVEQVNGDWGRGIYPPHVLYAVLKHYGLEDTLHTEMTGRGFAYTDLIDQLANAWGPTNNP
jgi:hypothetical protein